MPPILRRMPFRGTRSFEDRHCSSMFGGYFIARGYSHGACYSASDIGALFSVYENESFSLDVAEIVRHGWGGV
jgi:hypothetical protein